METSRRVLRLLAEGRTTDQIAEAMPGLAPGDVAAAAAQGLAALEAREAPPPPTRAERLARAREEHPRAYEPWTEAEDALLLRRFDEGGSLRQLARETGRPPGAVRARLDRWLGPSWRSRGVGASESLRGREEGPRSGRRAL